MNNNRKFFAIKDLQNTEELKNFTILTENGGSFRVHLEIMALFSDFFKQICLKADRKSSPDQVILGIPKEIMATIIDFAYNNKLILWHNKIRELIYAAELLKISALVDLCKAFLVSNLSTANCISIYALSKIYCYSDVQIKVQQFVLQHFEEIHETNPQYLSLPLLDLTSLLSSDTLNVRNEESVYWAILKWVEHDVSKRTMYLPPLLRLALRVGLCLPEAYHGMIWIEDLMYVIGGFNGQECFNSVRCFDPVSHVWEEKGCMYDRRCYISVAAIGKHIYAMGGYDGSRRMKTCERYDPDSNQWKMVASMLHIRSDASADSLDGKIYIVGGFNGINVLSSVECYNPETDNWTEVRRMHSPRSGVKVVAFQGYLYAIGGFDGAQRLETVERYDTMRNTWTYVAPMLGPRSNFAVSMLEGLIYVMGGFNGLRTIATVEVYDPQRNSWSQITDLNLNRSALAACSVSNISTASEYCYIGSQFLQY